MSVRAAGPVKVHIEMYYYSSNKIDRCPISLICLFSKLLYPYKQTFKKLVIPEKNALSQFIGDIRDTANTQNLVPQEGEGSDSDLIPEVGEGAATSSTSGSESSA